MGKVRYINRHSRRISHVFDSSDEDFNIAICNPNLRIWKDHYVLGYSSVAAKAIYSLCRHCQKMQQKQALTLDGDE